MKTFSVHFIDAKDDQMNHKLMQAEDIYYVCAYMKSLGHEITRIEETTDMPKKQEPKKTIACTTVTLKLHLYTVDEEDEYVPMVGEDVEEAIGYIKSKDDVAGYSITDMQITTEELDITNW